MCDGVSLFIFSEHPRHGYPNFLDPFVDELYPDAQRIDVVLDQLNTHDAETLIEIFGKTEADRLLARLCVA